MSGESRELRLPSSRHHDGEFIVSTDLHRTVDADSQYRVGPVNISTFPGISVTPLIAEDGSEIGVFLGDVIDHRSRRIVSGSVQLPRIETVDEDDRLRRVEDFVFTHSGRWVFIYAENGRHLLFVDANGCCSVVFDPAAKTAASTTGLLLADDEYVGRFDRQLYEALDIEQNERWFPSGLTAHHGVHRLLANHVLDLDNWSTRRHWPRRDFEWSDDVEGTAVRIGEIVTANVEAVLASSRPAQTLTAGSDTRFVLACVREVADALQFVTIRSPGAGLDVHHAKLLASRHDLQHDVLDYREASADEQRRWQYRVSHSIGGNNMRTHPSLQQVARHGRLIGGLGGETARGFFWRPGDHEGTELDAHAMAMRFGMPMHTRVVEATDRWLDATRGFNTLTQLDLAYIELRMSPWAFSPSYASNSIVPQLHPMICRETYDLMLQLAPDAKRNNLLIREGISALWPELLDLPINSYGDARDWLVLAKKATPARVARKLRRRFR